MQVNDKKQLHKATKEQYGVKSSKETVQKVNKKDGEPLLTKNYIITSLSDD